MINRDPRCVFVADSLGLAEVVAVWLADQGIPARVMDTATLGGLEGLTWLSKTAVSSRGLEVWALDLEQVKRANELLKEHSAALASKSLRDAVSLEPVVAACEECGHENVFGSADRGKVMSCEKCEAYLDVPSEEEEMDYETGDADAADERDNE